MTDEDEKIKKMRIRMERDAYSVLLSFKDGATPHQLEKRMDDTLGYSYINEYQKGGVRSMDHLLREHKQVRQTGDGKFKIIPTEEVSDLVALISKQKDGGKKKKGGAKGRRPATSAGYRNGYGGVAMRSSPKGVSAFRPSSRTTFAKPHYQNHQPFHRPTTAASSYQPSSQGGMGGNRQQFNQYVQRPLRAPSASFTPPTIQRPLSKPAPPASSISSSANPSSSSKRIPAQSPAPSVDRCSQHSETVKPATKTCQMPSIIEFAENSKKMMLKMYPKTVHLSELTELYNQEYNVTVDPLQVFSKSWKMLVTSTFKGWLEISGSDVGLKRDWFEKNGGNMSAKSAQPQAPYTVTAVPVSTPARSAQLNPKLPPVPPAKSQFATSSLPALQGFRYQIPAAPKSPTDLVTQKMKGLTVSSRQALPTPEKPPGIVQGKNPTFTNVKPNFKQNPYSKTLRPQSTMFAVPKKPLFSGLRPFTASAVRHQASLKSISDSSTSETSPSSSLEVHSQAPSTSPPLAPPVRMRSTQSTAPSHRLIGRALADVKKQDDEAPVPRRVETLEKSLYVSTTPTPTQPTKQPTTEPVAKTTVTAEERDEWDDPDMATSTQTTHAPSVAGRRPSRLPPMSKGSKSTASSHHSHKSTCSSRTTSPGRHLEQAVSCSLPDNEDW